MKTYWLLSEDDERVQRRFGSKHTSEIQLNCLRKYVVLERLIIQLKLIKF